MGLLSNYHNNMELFHIYVDAFLEHSHEFEYEVIKVFHHEKGCIVVGAMESGLFGQLFPKGIPVYSMEVVPGLVHWLSTLRSRVVQMGRWLAVGMWSLCVAEHVRSLCVRSESQKTRSIVIQIQWLSDWYVWVPGVAEAPCVIWWVAAWAVL